MNADAIENKERITPVSVTTNTSHSTSEIKNSNWHFSSDTDNNNNNNNNNNTYYGMRCMEYLSKRSLEEKYKESPKRQNISDKNWQHLSNMYLKRLEYNNSQAKRYHRFYLRRRACGFLPYRDNSEKVQDYPICRAESLPRTIVIADIKGQSKIPRGSRPNPNISYRSVVKTPGSRGKFQEKRVKFSNVILKHTY